jgi:hypothetical protein
MNLKKPLLLYFLHFFAVTATQAQDAKPAKSRVLISIFG